jgi:hypothetical protein
VWSGPERVIFNLDVATSNNEPGSMSEGTHILLLLGAIAWIWHNSRTAHEKVLEISREVCRDLNVQRLDDTVALRRLRLGWTRQGPTLRRVYGFEFSSDGANRCGGEIALLGMGLDWVRIDHPDGHYFIDIP